MPVTNAVEALLDEFGPLVKMENEKQRLFELEKSPHFDALSFFKSDEVSTTKILAYFLTPSAKHGGGDMFLRAMLEVLGVHISGDQLSSVIVLDSVPCFSLDRSRFIDILVRFQDRGQEYAIVLESKSHGAPDLPGQIGDYLRHLVGAYPRSKKYLFYMKGGGRPSPSSITSEAWGAALADGICFAVNYHSLIKRWVDSCSAQSKSQKLKDFFSSFLKFTGAEQEPTMTVSEQTKQTVAQLIESESAKGELTSRLDALVELSLLTNFVSETAIKGCLKRVETELKRKLPEWRMNLDTYLNKAGTRNEFELDLWKIGWKEANKEEAAATVFLGTWDTSFNIGWFKRSDVPAKPGMKFKKNGHFALSRGQHIQPANHIRDIRSAEGTRFLLTSQATSSLANDVLQFISDHEAKINESVGAAPKRRASVGGTTRTEIQSRESRGSKRSSGKTGKG